MNDFLLDEEDDDEIGYYDNDDQSSEDDGDEKDIVIDEDMSDEELDELIAAGKVDESVYKGKMTSKEIWLTSAYDDIITVGKKERTNAIEVAATVIVKANPKHTAAVTIGNIIKDMFHKQGHSRMVNSIYTPDTLLTSEDVDLDYKGEDDSGFNKMYAQAAREQITRFIDYLATRDLSKDSTISKRRKQRHIPAFIILLFSSGMYDLIINCPTLPPEYADQVQNALHRITTAKFDIVENLAKKYEDLGRHKVAERVRKMQLSWFYKEPAEIKGAAEYADLELTHEDVAIYRDYRSRFTNLSRAITQEVISDLIEVVIDKDAGIYEKLKDKTRSDAISDVKQVYQDWSKDNQSDSDLATRVIYKDAME